MHKVKFFLFTSALALTFLAAPAKADSLFDDGRLQSIIEHQAPTLVRVKAAIEVPAEEKADKSDKSDKAFTADNKKKGDKPAEEKKETVLRLGTGFFVSGDGQIITNASVVDGAKRLWYEVDNVPYLAEVKAIDVPTNIALLQAKTMPQKISTVNLTDTVTLPATGTLLVRLSMPLDFGATPTVGVVQGADTQFGARAFPTRYLRVQLPTGPGEAGGPIFDSQGRFVGVNVAVLPELGATYVLPARALSWVRENLLSGGHVYPYFGFNVEEEHSADAGTQLIVKNVDEHGPAAQAGLRIGDIVTDAAHHGVVSISDIRDAAFYIKPGQYLDMRVRRDGHDTPVSIQAQEKK